MSLNFHFKNIGLVAITTIFWGCSAGISQVTPTNINLDKVNNKEAIAVIKLSPRKTIDGYPENLLQFRNRGMDKDGFYQRFMRFDDSNLSNVSTKERYAIFKIDVTGTKEAKVVEALHEYDPITQKVKFITGGGCGGELLTVQISEPGIYYLGDLSYGKSVTRIGEVKFEFSVDTNLDAVIPYLKKQYPQIPSDKIKIAPIKSYWDRSKCAPNVIYI